MNNPAFKDEQLWSVVLAGGNGERLSKFVQNRLGQNKAKQYCAFTGTRSMFQHTLDRSDQIISPERRITVIARDHFDEAKMQFASRSSGKLILQPVNRDTAAGIFLSVARVRAHNPDAVVLIYPSDHFVYPEKRFVEITHTMALIAWRMKHWILLLGVSPDSPEQEYGWIQPGAHLGRIDGCRLRLTRSFLEKPSLSECRKAMASGGLWNTMVTAAKVETLWNLGRQLLPEITDLFEAYSKSIGNGHEDQVLEDIYREMPKRNFSFHLLQKCPRHVLVMELDDVVWSDWGNPERIKATLRRFGRDPESCLDQVAAEAG